MIIEHKVNVQHYRIDLIITKTVILSSSQIERNKRVHDYD